MAEHKEKTTKVRIPEIIISLEEYNRKKSIWDEYYLKVRDTHAYERYIQQGIAYRLGDMKFVNGCTLQAKKDLETENKDLKEPSFKNPEDLKRSGKLGIREWLLMNLNPEKETDRTQIQEINSVFSGDARDMAVETFISKES